MGADPCLYGKWGRCAGTPSQFARSKGHVKIARILEQAEAEQEEDSSDDEESSEDDEEDEEEDAKFPTPSEIAQRQREISQLVTEIQAKTDEKSQLQQQVQVLGTELSRLSRNLSRLSDDSGQLLNRSKREINMEEAAAHGVDDCPTCPVCLGTPRNKIFSCTQCDASLCNACQSPLEACPICRMEFTAEIRPRRNRWAEKLVQHIRQKKNDGDS